MKPFIFLAYSLIVWVSVLVVLPPAGMAEVAEEEEKPRLPLGLEVFLKKPEPQRYDLHVHLTNLSDEPVEVDVRDLPWNPTDGPTWLSGFRLDDKRTAITQHPPIGRFGSRMVKLLPGESIQDRIVLNPRFPALLDDIATSGVRLEWECPPASLKFICKPGAPNVITIPKGDPGIPDAHIIDGQVCRSMAERIGLIRVPEGHDVLFLLAGESLMTDLEKLRSRLLEVEDYVRECFPAWTNSWAVSFFTDKKYAGFLNEGDNQRYFDQGLWQEANIGQYSSQIRTLFRFPWIKKRADTVYLSLYQSSQHDPV